MGILKLKRDICLLETKENKNTFIIMDSNTSSIALGFILTMCLISSSFARPVLSELEKAKLSEEQIQKLRDILGTGGTYRPGMISFRNHNKIDVNSNPEESLDIITTTLQPDETSISNATSDESNEIAKNIVKLPSGSDLQLNEIPYSTIGKNKRHRKKSKVIVKCFNCTINL